MPNQPGSHRVNIIIEAVDENFRPTIAGAMNHQFDAVATDLATAYHSPRLSDAIAVRVILQNDYYIRAANIQTAQGNPLTHQNNNNNNNNASPNRIGTLPALPKILSAAARLLGFLPRVNLAALPEDSKDCSICLEPFPASNANGGADTPLRLRCKHVVGRACIEQWILGGHNSCPFCRAAIFELAIARVM